MLTYIFTYFDYICMCVDIYVCIQGVTGQVQLVMMGSGDERYANFLRRAEAENKGKV